MALTWCQVVKRWKESRSSTAHLTSVAEAHSFASGSGFCFIWFFIHPTWNSFHSKPYSKHLDNDWEGSVGKGALCQAWWMSIVCRTHRVERENRFSQAVLWPHVHACSMYKEEQNFNIKILEHIMCRVSRGQNPSLNVESLHVSYIPDSHTLQVILCSFGCSSSEEVTHGIFHMCPMLVLRKFQILMHFRFFRISDGKHNLNSFLFF